MTPCIFNQAFEPLIIQAIQMADFGDKSPFVDDDELDPNAISHYSSLSVNPDIADGKKATSPTGSLSKSGRFRTVLFILFSELCERLTYYSISANLVLFCTSVLDFPSDTAAVIALVFSGTAFFSPVFGGWVADSIAGKYNTIYGGLLVYITGNVITLVMV